MGKLPHAIATGNQYSHTEWTNSNLDHFHNAEASRHAAEKIKAEAALLINDRNTKTVACQLDVKGRLGDRARDIREWREELARELSRLEEEVEHLTEANRHLEYAASQTSRPLRISQECLSERENRVGIDQVKDGVEVKLRLEVEVIKKYQLRMKVLLEKVKRQSDQNMERKNRLLTDLGLKDEAYSIDQNCYVIHNNSDDTGLYSGIERVEQAASVPQSWQNYSQVNLKESAASREASEELRADIDALISEAAADMLNHWTNANREFQERISETQDIQSKLTSHLHLVDKEILEMDSLIELLRSTRLAKQAPLKVAQTRLQKRSHRPDIEACNDPPHNRLVDEVAIIKDSILLLDQKITEAEAARLDLVSNKQRLENDIRVKENSLKIDQQKCMTLRLNFPFNSRCSVTSKRVERRKYKVDLTVD